MGHRAASVEDLVAGAGLPLLRLAARPRLCRPGQLAPRELVPAPGRPDEGGAVLPAHGLRLRPTACSCSCRSRPRPRRSSATTPTSRRPPRAGCATRRPTSRAITERLGLGASSQVVELASNDGYLLQYFVERGIPVLGVEPAANVAATAIERGIPTRVEFFGAATAAGAEGRRHRRRPRARQQRARPRARPERLRRGRADPPQARGHRDLRVPAPASADRAHRVRHDLPRALLVLLAARRAERCSPRTAWRSSTSRSCARHGGSLRLYVRHARCRAAGARGWHELLAREQAAGLDRIETYGAFEQQVRATKRDLLEFLIGVRREGAARRRLRRAGEGKHAAQLLRRPRRPRRLRRRPEPAQAGALPSRDAAPDLLARARSRRPSPTTC